MHSEDRITYFARTNHRNTRTRFGIRKRDRLMHLYTVGRTGTGKSTLLKTLILQDLQAGEGLALLDPHGDLVEEVVKLIPAARRKDVLYLNVPDSRCRFSFNPFAGIPSGKRALAAAGMVEVFKKLWPDDWGPRLEHLLRNVVFTLLETPGASLADIPRLLADREYRRRAVAGVTNEEVRVFWRDEYERYSPGMRGVVVAPSRTKWGLS